MTADPRQQRLAVARRVLDVERAGLEAVCDRLDERFVRALDVLLACRGKVIVTGIGKSGAVCRKIAATLSDPSFGTRSALSPPCSRVRPTAWWS